jgi:transcriptional regulator NrdR family protein
MTTPDEKPAPAPRFLVCPMCKGTRFEVLYTRNRAGGKWRRRACLACGWQVTTVERQLGRDP